MQPLGDSPTAVPGVAAAGAGAGVIAVKSRHPLSLERLEIPTGTSALPSAQAVWSPILALRTFVEPLTSRASAAFRNFHISFHEPEEEGVGGVTTMSTLPAGAAAPPTPPPLPEAVAAAPAMDDEEQGGGARNGEERRKELSSPTAVRVAAVAPEEIQPAASAEPFWPAGSQGMEVSAVSNGHDRADGGGGDGERKRADTAEMAEQGEREECRAVV